MGSGFAVLLALFISMPMAVAQIATPAVSAEPGISRTVNAADALPATGSESWNVHGQFTVVTQRHGVFAAGGMGILIGDGQLSHYAREQILELYYAVNLNKTLTVSGDLQYVKNPAYNADRGPVSIAGLRLHAEF